MSLVLLTLLIIAELLQTGKSEKTIDELVAEIQQTTKAERQQVRTSLCAFSTDSALIFVLI